MKEKKILLYGPLPPLFSGQSVSFLNVLKSIEKHNPLVINTQKFKNKLLSFLYVQLLCLYFFLTKKIKILYITTSRSKVGLAREFLTLLLAKFYNVKVINHLHGNDFNNIYGKSRFIKKIVKYVYSHISISIVLNEQMKAHYKDFPKMKIKVVPNNYDSIIDKELIDFDKKEGVIFLSNIMFTKGVIIFLEAAEIILSNNNTNIYIAGEFVGDYLKKKSEIKRIFYLKYNSIKEKFPDKIFYLGPVFGNEKINLLKNTSIFCLPTFHRSEAFPISIIEAMALGNAVIVNNHNDLNNLVNNTNGCLIQNLNSIQLADKILELLNNPDLKNIQIFNSVDSKKRYSFKNFKKNIENILLDC